MNYDKVNIPIEHAASLFSKLPPERKGQWTALITAAKARRLDTLIVLDDDPTGTQTVHGIPVLTEWSEKSLLKELRRATPVLFILTNSRSLEVALAEEVAFEIGRNIASACKRAQKQCWVISRSDSTLRGHYPEEVNALELGLQYDKAVHFIIPAFFEGGRFTLHDIHYVQKEKSLIPAAQTPYARDQAFGFQSSNLKSWIEEKTKGAVSSSEVVSISVEELRQQPVEYLSEKIRGMETGTTCIVNAVAYADLQLFVLALLNSGVKPILRTAASLVAAVAALDQKPMLTGVEVTTPGENGGLVVIGSFVPITTSQLKHLLTSYPNLHQIKLDVRAALQIITIEKRVEAMAHEIDQALESGQTVVLYTSRELVATHSNTKNQEIGQRISQIVTDVIRRIRVRPTFLVTKGGVTSSDVATKSLGVKRALVQGQIIKGIPVWKLGTETKFPGLSQVIFPGNVGTEKSLTEVLKILFS